MTPRHLLSPARLAGSGLLAAQSDERLVDLLRAGSEPAFEAIVSRYRGPLLRYCSGLLGRERAEDAVQQTFVNAYEAMRKDDRPLRLKPWLYRIAHNVAHNALRSNALRDEPLGEEGVAADRPDLVVERRDRLRAVLASVQSLPARQRDALLLRELEGRSYEEIAVALGTEGGAVRQLLNRARTTLRTAATAVTPATLLLRVPASGVEGGESVAARVAELTGAAGSGVAAKVAATALVTGAVAGGAAVAPLDDPGGKPPDRPRTEVTPPRGEPRVAAAAPIAPEPDTVSDEAPGGRPGGVGDDRRRDDDRSGPGDGDREDDREGDSSGPGSGEDDDGSNSGPGSASSGSGSSGSDSDSSGSGSGSSGSGSSGSGGSDSGSSGSGSGSSGSGSGLSGSGSSGSGSSGSGSSGPGSGSSGSGSGSSGSGSSSGSYGSGSSSSGSPAPEIEPAEAGAD